MENSSPIFEFKTIKDFDVGMGTEVERLNEQSDTVDMTDCEINLIVWLILEHGIEKAVRPLMTVRNRTETDGGEDAVDHNASSARVAHHTKHLVQKLFRSTGIQFPYKEFKEYRKQFLTYCKMAENFKGRQCTSVEDTFSYLRSKESQFEEYYEIIEKKGTGGFGSVLKVFRKDDPTKYYLAAKKIDMEKVTMDSFLETLVELKNLKKLTQLSERPGGDKVIAFKGCWLEFSKSSQKRENNSHLCVYLLMDHCYINLATWQEEKRNSNCRVVSYKKLLDIFYQLVCGLEFIHGANIIHLDINPENILWKTDECKELCISDFGLSKDITCSKELHQCGTYPYYAPESVPTFQSDIYSLGVTILELAADISTKNELVDRIGRPNYSTNYDSAIEDLITNMLSKNPKDRIQLKGIKDTLIQLIGHSSAC